MDRSRSLWLACALAIAGCGSPDAVVLNVSGDAPATQYDLYVHDDDANQIIFHSNFTPFAAPGATADITRTPVRLGLKLSRGGRFTLLLVGVIGEVQGGKPGPTATQLFWAGRFQVGGTISVDAPLLTVPKGDDADGDLFPDVNTFGPHVLAAQALYGSHPELLDCDDKTDDPLSPTGQSIKLHAADINPFASEICGDGYDENCDGSGDEACVDNDHDHDFRGSDCDDNDPKRHHATDIDPFPDPPNCCGRNLGKGGSADEGTDFLHGAGDPGCFAAKCQRDLLLCPLSRCNDGIDESCQGQDTACVVDADCDGYPPPPQGNDCDDHDPSVHPNAPEPCGSTKDFNCDGQIGEGCVPCDLDGDGFERADAANGCPDKNDKHPGQVDCDDYDSGVFPGETAPTGGSEGGFGTLQKLTAALRSGCRRVYQSTGAVATGTARIPVPGGGSWMIGDADCNGVAYDACPAPACDADGDGFPNANPGCNPGGLAVDCNDADPTFFPGAPDKCGDGMAQDCSSDHACTNDADRDGYNAGGDDCDDTNPNIHPWATELCDGADNDCDGLVDEGNPAPNGAPLVDPVAPTQIVSCTDSNIGECAKTPGLCVCSSVTAAGTFVDPMGRRNFCPGEGGAPAPVKPPRCIGAGQPKPQTCDACNKRDDDCDGRVDAPDGKNLAEKGMTCGIGVGQCRPSLIVGCDYSQTNCFAQFGRMSLCSSGMVCSPGAVCPVAELCNGFDDDCDGMLGGSAAAPPAWPSAGPPTATMDERDHDGDGYLACETCGTLPLAPGVRGCSDCDDNAGAVHPAALELCNGKNDNCVLPWVDGSDQCPGTATPACCGASGCKNTQSDPAACGSCATPCSTATANQCVAGGCSCGGGPACTGGLVCAGTRCAQALGTGCTAGGQCASNNCVDGYCCDAPCGGQCQSCKASPGTCVTIVGPPVAPRAACASDGTVCGGACDGANPNACGYPGAATACGPTGCTDPTHVAVPGTCAGGGSCVGASTMACMAGHACLSGACVSVCTNDSQCAAGYYCSSSGGCLLQKSSGATCNLSTDCRVSGACRECASGFCAFGVCCSTACNNGQPSTCSGGTQTNYSCPGGTCSSGTVGCGAYVCSGAACLSKCTSDASCAAGDWCESAAAAGTANPTCVARLASGTACNAADCQAGGCLQCQGGRTCPLGMSCP